MHWSCNLTRSVVCAGLAAVTSAGAANYVFPAGAKVADITKSPYFADNTGVTDVSAILTRALGDDNRDQNGWGCHIVYLPNGVYLVKNTVKWRFPPYTVGPHLVGQSRDGVIIKLAKGTWPIGTEYKAVIQTGEGVAQNFNRGLFNLTVLVDSNNAGAYGVYYYGNNQSLMSDVTIRSADGKGVCGLWLGHWQTNGGGGGEQGPAMVRRVSIAGFDEGIASNALNSITLSHINLTGQKIVGIFNDNHPIYIDSLTSNNHCTAVHSTGPLVLVNAILSGGASDQPAILNENDLSYIRSVTASGYQRALSSTKGNAPTGLAVTEFTASTPLSLNPSPTRGLQLPVKYPPEPAWESDTGKWAIVADYMTNGRTATQALQAAIDDPTKTTVCISRDNDYVITGPVYLRGAITRLIGTGGTLNGPNGSLVIDDGAGPVVKLEKIGCNTGPMTIVKKTSRTAVIESDLAGPIRIQGGGETYITDVVVHTEVNHPDARVWAWQFDAEGADSNLVVRAGTVRIFGWKDEGTGEPLACLGGRTEILGFLEYSNSDNHGGMAVATITGTAAVSIAGFSQMNWTNTAYDLLVKETRGGVTKTLLTSANPTGWGYSLFTAYDSTLGARPVFAPSARIAVTPTSFAFFSAMGRRLAAHSKFRAGTRAPGVYLCAHQDDGAQVIRIMTIK